MSGGPHGLPRSDRTPTLGASTLLLIVAVAILIAVPTRDYGSADRTIEPNHPYVGAMSSRPPAMRVLPEGPWIHPDVGGESSLSIVPHDPADFPNDGLETNITGFVPQLLGPVTSFQVAVEEKIGSYDAVFGLFQNTTFGPIGFFEVFTSANDTTAHLAYGAPTATAPGFGYQFRLARTSGTEWNLSVNGAPFSVNAAAGSFDFGAVRATDPTGLAFSEVAFYQSSTAAVVPSALTATTAVALRQPGGWYLPHNATTEFLGAASGAWGAEGRAQQGSLAPGEVRTGSSLPPDTNGTVLWTGGPVPIALTVQLASETIRATLPVVASAEVKDRNGTAIPSVPLAIADSRGGVPSTYGNLTNALGAAQLKLLTPNVSAAGTDLISVFTTILGYEGLTSVALILTPAIEIELSASPATPSVVTNGSIVLTFRAETSGATVAFAAVEFSTTLGGSLAIAFAQSGSDGSVSNTFHAGPAPATVTIRASVIEPGAWGHLTMTVRIVRPPPDPWTRSEPYVVLAIAAALVALIVVALRRRKVGRLPRLAFLPDEPAAGPARRADDVGPPITRTPPSGGSP